MPENYESHDAIYLVAHHEAMSCFAMDQLTTIVSHLTNSNKFSLAQTMEIVGIFAAAAQEAFPDGAADKTTLATTLASCARNAIDDFCTDRVKFFQLN